MSRTLLSMTHNRRANTVTRHYSDGTVEEREYVQSERTKRAVEFMRERRKANPSQGARILKETLDRLDAEDAARKAKNARDGNGGDAVLMGLIGLARLFMLR